MVYLVTANQELFENDSYKVISVGDSLELLKSLKVVGLDTETMGLDPYTKDLLSIQLGNKDFQVVVDCTTVKPTLYKEYLESDRTFLGWNLKFDLKFLYRQGIYPKTVYDGFLAEKLLWLGYPAGVHSLSLKSAGLNYLGIELDKSIRGKIIYAGLQPDVIQYAAKDVAYLEDIILCQWKELQKKELQNAIKVENKFVLSLAYCEYCGIKLDVNKWKAKMAKDQARQDKALEACNKWLIENEPDSPYIFIDRQGDLFTGFNLEPQVRLNWNSSTQLIPLFKKYGLDLKTKDKTTGKFKDSIDAKILKPQKDKCSLIPLYLNYKEAVKVTSTYGQNFLNQINPVSHRVHTNFQQMGADTTRITSGGKDKGNNVEYVNLLNLPKDEETRACFVAEEGNSWISIDYSGQESFLMASIANDEAMIKELTYGDKDLHTLTAKIVYSEIPKDATANEVKTKYHDLRQKAKGYEFAFNYAGNATTIKQNFGLTDEEANRIYDSYMSGFNGLKAYQDFRKKDWFEKGYILLNPITGHKAYIYDYDDLLKAKTRFKEPGFWDYYKEMKAEDPLCDTVLTVRNFFKKKSDIDRHSVNYPIQATGSMCLRYAMIEFFEYLRNNNLIGKVLICVTPYDEINCEAPKEIAETIAKEVHSCMVNAGKIFCTRCKLDADISYNKEGSLPTYWVH